MAFPGVLSQMSPVGEERGVMNFKWSHIRSLLQDFCALYQTLNTFTEILWFALLLALLNMSLYQCWAAVNRIDPAVTVTSSALWSTATVFLLNTRGRQRTAYWNLQTELTLLETSIGVTQSLLLTFFLFPCSNKPR